MNFWNFNLFCYLCQHVFDPECNELFWSQFRNISLGFKVSNITQFKEIDDCYLQDFQLVYENNSEILVEYNYFMDIEKIVDYVEKEILFDENFSFFITYNYFHLPKPIFNFLENNKKKNVKKDYSFINFNKKSLFKLLPNIFETTRNISTIYFDLYINDSVGFFTSNGEPKLSYFWIKNFLKI